MLLTTATTTSNNLSRFLNKCGGRFYVINGIKLTFLRFNGKWQISCALADFRCFVLSSSGVGRIIITGHKPPMDRKVKMSQFVLRQRYLLLSIYLLNISINLEIKKQESERTNACFVVPFNFSGKAD